MSGGNAVTDHGWLASMEIASAKTTARVNESDSAPSLLLIRHTTVRSDEASS